MKIDSKILEKFIKKVCINGIISDCVMKFESDGLHITVKERQNGCANTGILKASCFSEYTPMEVADKDTQLLLTFLRDMNGPVELSVSENRFIMKSGKTDIKLTMPKVEFVDSNLESVPSLNHDACFIIGSDILLHSKKKFDQLKVPNVIIKVENNELSIIVGEENFNQIVIKDTIEYKNAIGKFGSILMNIINILDGNINISFNNDYPMLITETTEDYIIKWLIAPMLEQE